MRRALAALPLLLTLAACAAGPAGVNHMPGSPEAALRLQLAEAALQGGSAHDAIGLYEQARTEDPGSIPAMLGLAAAQNVAGDPVAALATLREAHRLAPRDEQVTLGLSRALLALGKADEAESLLRPLASSTATSDVGAWTMLGVALDNQGRHHEAQEIYRRGLALAPASVPLRNNLALSLALSGAAGEAVEILRLLPPSPGVAKRIRHNLAVALLAGGEEQAARSLLAQELPAEEIETVMAHLRILQPQTAAAAGS